MVAKGDDRPAMDLAPPRQETPMLYEFKSRATGTITMTEPVGRKVLEIIGKSPDAQGIITVQQIPGAIQALKAAADRDRKAEEAARKGTKDEDDDDAKNYVGISQRVVPLIEMLGEALKAGKDVTWGV